MESICAEMLAPQRLEFVQCFRTPFTSQHGPSRVRELYARLAALYEVPAACVLATHGSDEAIDVLRLLWAGDENGVSFDGEFFSFTNLCSFPKPCGAGTLPIHVGGASRPAARRAGQRGDGYFPGGQLTAGERASRLELMHSAASAAGRDPAALEYTRWVPASVSAADAATHAALGVTRLVAALSSPDLDGQREEMSALAGRLGLG